MFSQIRSIFRQLLNGSWQSRLYVFFIFLGLAWVGFGLALLARSWDTSLEITPELLDEVAPDKALQMIAIDVAGGVVRPGIYSLPPAARVGDAIEAAGGLSTQADIRYVHESINLAAKINDGQKIFIPVVGLKATPTSSEGQAVGPASNTKFISFNQASQTELESLPGIGEKKATEIVEHRPYASLNEVKSIVSVSEKQWLEIEKSATL